MNLVRFVVVGIAAFLGLAGCATPPALSELRDVSEKSTFTLTKPYIVTVAKRGLGSGGEHGLNVGTYTAIKENETGTFYKGDGYCVVFGSGTTYHSAEGGVWVPKLQGQAPRLFIYSFRESKRATSLQQLFTPTGDSESANPSASAIAGSTSVGASVGAFANPSVPMNQGIGGGLVAGLLVGAILDANKDLEEMALVFSIEEPEFLALLPSRSASK